MGADPGVRNRLAAQARAVRTRIAAWVVLLTALGLLGAGVAAYVVESDRIDERISRELGNEITQLNDVIDRKGIDPATGQRLHEPPLTSARQAMRLALLRNVPPDRNETIVAFLDGDPVMMAGGTRPRYAPLLKDATFVQAVRGLMPDGGARQLDTKVGEIVMAVKPVRDATATGAYVPVYFPADERAEFVSLMRTYALVAGLALVLVSVGAWVVSDRLLQPLRQMRATAQEISHTDLSRRLETTGNDDITDLGNTFNAMLDRLEHSFAEQRRFLDDAGHELRTPITIVRGHLELLDPEHVPDTEAARDLVLDEVDRMARLVDDMIVLAKSGRPDFVKAVEADAGVLTDEVLDKVRALGDRSWKLDERAEGTVRVDPQRVTQALLALATNAVQHTGPGDVIALGSAHEGGRVRWWVRDTGPGVDPADAERIFERFQRGDQARGPEGSGLGLSIVRAIASAHGGRVRLDSKPGEGSTFTIVLPARAYTVDPYDDQTYEDETENR
jgi:two-component system, OmpR family, sensor kinase